MFKIKAVSTITVFVLLYISVDTFYAHVEALA